MTKKKKKPQKKRLFKKKTRKKISKGLLISLAVLIMYATPYTNTYALEPEQVKAGNGRVIVW